MGSILLLCRLFGLDAAMTASLLPKSVTTPIAISVSQAHGGIGPITVVAVLITGIFGSIAAPLLIKLFRVKDPMTAGLAIGASSHAVGTSKALELGETEGAMSGLAIGVCGLITVVLSLFLMSGIRTPRRRRGRSLSKKWQSHFFGESRSLHAQGLSACGSQDPTLAA